MNTASTDIFYLDAKGDMDAAHFVAERRRGWKVGGVTMDRILRAQSAINVQATEDETIQGENGQECNKKS